MSFSYTKKRLGRSYAKGKIPAPSIASFKSISKLLFITSMLLTISGYWLDSIIYVRLYEIPAIQLSGTLLILIGYFGLSRTFNTLGDNYSPSFDAYLPFRLITFGSYRVIRHPIYLFNLFVSFGLALSSGSGVVAMTTLAGLFFILKIISIEEAYLTKDFPDYKNYSKNTWRLIPFLY